jgi:hypothetical protein
VEIKPGGGGDPSQGDEKDQKSAVNVKNRPERQRFSFEEFVREPSRKSRKNNDHDLDESQQHEIADVEDWMFDLLV